MQNSEIFIKKTITIKKTIIIFGLPYRLASLLIYKFVLQSL